MVATVSSLSLIISKQKSKVRLTFEIFELSYLALATGKFENSEISQRFFSVSGLIGILYLTMICNGGNCFHAFPDYFRATE